MACKRDFQAKKEKHMGRQWLHRSAFNSFGGVERDR